MTEITERKLNCFIIMPITTPEIYFEEYRDGSDHFDHVLNSLFIPATEKAGFKAIPPKSKGSNVIHADIIGNLATSDLVLCDISVLNPNVFFELGIRTALNKTVALVVDDKIEDLPFDTNMIHTHKYKSSLDGWNKESEIDLLSKHISDAYSQNESQNPLWKYFGIAQTGRFSPEETTIDDKLDLILKEIISQGRHAADKELIDSLTSKVFIDSLGKMRRTKSRGILGGLSDEERKIDPQLVNALSEDGLSSGTIREMRQRFERSKDALSPNDPDKKK